MDGVAPDGSPVAVYLALPAGETPDLIHRAVAPGGSILELGSGPGRITRPLADLGHTVTAIDDSPEMLAHVDCAEAVLTDLFTLDLGRTFDAVVAGSHLINAPGRRDDLLAVCRRHVATGGAVLIERYTKETPPAEPQRDIGPVRVEFELLAVDADGFRARSTYRLGERSWVQEYAVCTVTEDMLTAEAAAAGLRFVRWLDDARKWALLTP